MASDWIVVEATVAGCAAEISINEIPVGRVGHEQARRLVMPVNQYVVAGVNVLGMTVNPGPTPSAAERPAPEPVRAGAAAATVALVRYRAGTVTGDGSGEVLRRLEWAGRADNEPEEFPQRVAAEVTVPLQVGPWNWQNAEPLELTPETVEQVAGVIELIRSGLDAGDTQPFMELGARALQEIARAFGDSPDQGVKTLRAVVDHSRHAKFWRFPPVPRELWDLRLVAGGRMIECVDQRWEPLVRSITDEEDNSFAMPLFVGRTGGRWVVLR